MHKSTIREKRKQNHESQFCIPHLKLVDSTGLQRVENEKNVVYKALNLKFICYGPTYWNTGNLPHMVLHLLEQSAQSPNCFNFLSAFLDSSPVGKNLVVNI